MALSQSIVPWFAGIGLPVPNEQQREYDAAVNKED